MSNRIKDLTGEKFGMLKVVSRSEIGINGKTAWVCRCSCGNMKITRSSQLMSGNIKSCGCLRVKKMSIVGKMPNNKTHGMSKSSIYSRWCGIIKRCFNKNCKSYKNYGGRGISVCSEWLKFENFYNDMKDSFNEKLTLERINNEDGYYKENCRWASRLEQNRNSRRNKDYEKKYNIKKLSKSSKGSC